MKSVIILSIFILLFLVISSCEKQAYQIYSTGTFEANEVVVSSKATGQILEMLIEEGQAIQKDQIIARIETDKLLLQKDQLQASLDELHLNASLFKESELKAQIQYQNLKTRFDRFEKLLQEKSVSQQQFDDLSSQLEVAENQLKSARIQLKTIAAKERQLQAQLNLVDQQISDCEVRAPLAGVVVQKLKETGELATVGSTLVQIADLNQMEITIYISESDLGLIKLGESLSIQIDSFPERIFEGKINWISPKAEFTPKNVQTKEARTNIVYAVKLAVENPDGIFKIGMPADIFRK